MRSSPVCLPSGSAYLGMCLFAHWTSNVKEHTSKLDSGNPGITVLPMTTLTFKVRDEEAQAIRQRAQAVGLSLSAYLRLRATPASPPPPRIVKAKYSGAPVFKGHPDYIPLSLESVNEMLSDFP